MFRLDWRTKLRLKDLCKLSETTCMVRVAFCIKTEIPQRIPSVGFREPLKEQHTIFLIK